MTPAQGRILAQAYWDARNDIRLARLEPPLTIDQLPEKYQKMLKTVTILTPDGNKEFSDIPF